MEPAPHDLTIFENNKPLVVEAFRGGEFDGVEVVNEVIERDFFRFLGSEKLLHELAQSYPTPRKKEEVPVWFYIAADLAMRLHGEHSFNAFPYIVRSGGLLSLLAPVDAQRRIDKDSGDLHLHCAGFNKKNSYKRGTPCDADFLRKLARDTKPDDLEAWFAEAIPRCWKKRRAFDPEGIFIGDGSYLFVPDNPAYEGSERLWFDAHNHPVSRDEVPPEQQQELRLRRCYKMVTLLHTNRKGDFFYYMGARVVSGRTHEAPVFYSMIEDFVRAVGRGVMKLLLLDRGFLDGEGIGRLKSQHRIDVVIPLRKNMDLFVDAVGLGSAADAPWREVPVPTPAPRPIPPERPASIIKREAKRRRTIEERRAEPPAAPSTHRLLDLRAMKTWSSCPVPLNVVLQREVQADGKEHLWAIATTASYVDPLQVRDNYALRTACEERHRQLKCFQDLAKFTARTRSLVTNQIIFTLLTYSLLQLQLFRKERADLNQKTLPRVREKLLPAIEQVVLFHQSYFAFLTMLEHQELLLTLSETARIKILAKTQQLRRTMFEVPAPRRPPP